MSRKRFKDILRFIRFDDFQTREERLQRIPVTKLPKDKLAAVQDMLSLFDKNIRHSYHPGPKVCIDEQLQTFRGKCSFKVFMKSKPARFGLKYWLCCDVSTNYVWSLQLYRGGIFN